MITRITYGALILAISASCTSPLTSEWEVQYISQDSLKGHYTFFGSSLAFRKHGECFIPKVDVTKEWLCPCRYFVHGDSITINACSPIFSGAFHWEINGENGLLKLENDSLYIVASDLIKRFEKILEPATR